MKSKEVNNARRVVITGLGVVSSLGIGWQEFWKNLLAGKSGISKITAFDTSKYDHHYGGEIKNFDPTQFMSRKKAERLGRASQMAIAASKMALKDAHLQISETDTNRMGVYLGTTMGESQILEILNKTLCMGGFDQVNPRLIPIYPTEVISRSIAHELRLNGKSLIFANACSAGNYSIGYAFDCIKQGKADVMVAGGVDAFSRLSLTGFSRLIAIAPKKCQPFDKGREGMIPGEGAGIVILESLGYAQKRKAPIYAEVLGYGISCSACHMIEPSIVGITKALQKTLRNSGIRTNQVDYISAHGTGTIENDEAECKAINRVFGKRTAKIPVSSIKSMLGHTMGAASAFGAIACCLVIKYGHIPPTINHGEDDPRCNIDCVPNKSRSHKAQVVLNNSQAFGGNNACLVVGSL